jgi:hypothetical protein
MEEEMKLTSRLPVFCNVLAACALSVGLLSIATPATSAAPATGWLRLAHLSPDTPAVDVYLYSLGNPHARLVLHHVSYGTVSPYLKAAAGTYTVAMRPAGAASSSPPVLSTAVHVRAGDAYTVAGMGPAAGLRLQVLNDRLTSPRGQAMIRVIQASMREHLVTVRAGAHVLGKNLAFATATSYRAVSRGRITVRAVGATERALNKLTLQAGTIHTLVVLDEPGRLRIDNLEDAAGSKVLPAGAPATGLGGTAPQQKPPGVTWLAFITAGLLIAVSGLLRFRRGRRPGLSMR